MRAISALAIAGLLAGTAFGAVMETVSFTAVDSQGSAGVMSYQATLTGGYTLGALDWDGFASVINPATWGSELTVDISGPLGSATITLGSGTTYDPGAPFSGSSTAFMGAGDPAGLWTFDFYESYDDGGDGLPDATWDNIDFMFNDYVPPSPNPWPGTEDFETGVPPTNWTAIVNNPYTWEAGTSAYEGMVAATCYYDETYSGTQSEWLLSPTATAVSGMELSGYTFGSIYWGTPPEQGGTYDNYDVEAWIVRGEVDSESGETDDTFLGLLDDFWVTSWQYEQFLFDLDAAGLTPGEEFRIGFRYYGYDGAQANIDYVTLTPEPSALALLALGGLALLRRR